MSAMVEVPVTVFKKQRRSESAILKAKPKKLIAVVSPQPRNNPTVSSQFIRIFKEFCTLFVIVHWSRNISVLVGCMVVLSNMKNVIS